VKGWERVRPWGVEGDEKEGEIKKKQVLIEDEDGS
jgi:hypothetical protein